MSQTEEILKDRIRKMENWIEEQGPELQDYIKRYGDSLLPECPGNGGQAIYWADQAQLANLRRELAAFRNHRREANYLSGLIDCYCDLSQIYTRMSQGYS